MQRDVTIEWNRGKIQEKEWEWGIPWIIIKCVNRNLRLFFIFFNNFHNLEGHVVLKFEPLFPSTLFKTVFVSAIVLAYMVNTY